MEISSKWCPSRNHIGTNTINIFINNIDSGIECTITSFARDMELSGAVDKLLLDVSSLLQGHCC